MNIPDRLPYKQLRTQTEQLWASRKYDIMAHGYQYYKEVAVQFRHASTSSDLTLIEQRIQQITELPYNYPGMSTTIQHMWGYVRRQVTEEERRQYDSLWSIFRADPDSHDLLESSKPLLQFLHHMASQYHIPYLQLSFQAGFSFLRQRS